MIWEEEYFFESIKDELKDYLIDDKENFRQLLSEIYEYEIKTDDLLELLNNEQTHSAAKTCIFRIKYLSLKNIKFAVDNTNSFGLKNIFKEADQVRDTFTNIISKIKNVRKEDSKGIKILPFINSKNVPLEEMTTKLQVFEVKNFNNLNEKVVESSVEYLKFYEILNLHCQQLILIEGGQGYGKSVQINYLLYTWANDDWEENFNDKLLLKIDLQSLDEFEVWEEIRIQNFEDDNFMTKEIIEKMIKENSKNIICLFDSFQNYKTLNKFLKNMNITKAVWCETASDIRRKKEINAFYKLRGFESEELFCNNILDKNDCEKCLKIVYESNDLIKDMLKIPQFYSIFLNLCVKNKYMEKMKNYEIIFSIIEMAIEENTGKNKLPKIFNDFCKICLQNQYENELKINQDQNLIENLKQYFTGILKIKMNKNSDTFSVKFLHSAFYCYFVFHQLLIHLENKEHSKILHGFENLISSENHWKIIVNFLSDKDKDNDMFKIIVDLFFEYTTRISECCKTENLNEERRDSLEINSNVEENLQEKESEHEIIISNEKSLKFIKSMENIDFFVTYQSYCQIEMCENFAIQHGKCLIYISFNEKSFNNELDREICMINEDINNSQLDKAIKIFQNYRCIVKFGIVQIKSNPFKIRELFEKLTLSHKTLNSIHISNFSLSSESCSTLKQMIEKCSDIENVNFKNLIFPRTKENWFNVIFKCFKQSSGKLKFIKIDNFAIPTEGLKCMTDIFKDCLNITNICFSNFKLSILTSNPSGRGSAQNLKYMNFDFETAFTKSLTTFQYLDLFNCCLDDNAINGLASLLVKSKKMIKVSIFFGKHISDATVDKLINSLKHSTGTLKEISFYEMLQREDKVGNSLKDLLIQCKHLEKVIFENCNLENSFKKICEGLNSSRETINFLSFEPYFICDYDFVQLIEYLKKSSRKISCKASFRLSDAKKIRALEEIKKKLNY